MGADARRVRRSDDRAVLPPPEYDVDVVATDHQEQWQSSFSSTGATTSLADDDVRDVYAFVHGTDEHDGGGAAASAPGAAGASSLDDPSSSHHRRADDEEDEDDLYSMLLRKGRLPPKAAGTGPGTGGTAAAAVSQHTANKHTATFNNKTKTNKSPRKRSLLDDVITNQKPQSPSPSPSQQQQQQAVADDATASCTESYSTFNDSWLGGVVSGEDVWHGSCGSNSLAWTPGNSAATVAAATPTSSSNAAASAASAEQQPRPPPSNASVVSSIPPLPFSPAAAEGSKKKKGGGGGARESLYTLLREAKPPQPENKTGSSALGKVEEEEGDDEDDGEGGGATEEGAASSSTSTATTTSSSTSTNATAGSTKERQRQQQKKQRLYAAALETENDDAAESAAAAAATATITASCAVGGAEKTIVQEQQQKRVRFGPVTVRTHRVILDSSSAGGYGLHGFGTCLFPLALDWPRADRVDQTTAYACGSSYFGNCPAQPLTADERRLRLAVVHDCTLAEVDRRQLRALRDEVRTVTARMNRRLPLLPAGQQHEQQQPVLDGIEEEEEEKEEEEEEEAKSTAPATETTKTMFLDYRTPSDWRTAGRTLEEEDDRPPKLPVPSERALVVDWKRNVITIETKAKRPVIIKRTASSSSSSSSSVASFDVLTTDNDDNSDDFQPVPWMDSVAAICYEDDDDEGGGDDAAAATAEEASSFPSSFDLEDAIQPFSPTVPWMDPVAALRDPTADSENDKDETPPPPQHEPILDWKELLREKMSALPLCTGASSSSDDGDDAALQSGEGEREEWQPEPLLDLSQVLTTSRRDDEHVVATNQAAVQGEEISGKIDISPSRGIAAASSPNPLETVVGLLRQERRRSQECQDSSSSDVESSENDDNCSNDDRATTFLQWNPEEDVVVSPLPVPRRHRRLNHSKQKQRGRRPRKLRQQTQPQQKSNPTESDEDESQHEQQEWKPKEFLELGPQLVRKGGEHSPPHDDKTAPAIEEPGNKLLPRKNKSGLRRPLLRHFATRHLEGYEHHDLMSLLAAAPATMDGKSETLGPQHEDEHQQKQQHVLKRERNNGTSDHSDSNNKWKPQEIPTLGHLLEQYRATTKPPVSS